MQKYIVHYNSHKYFDFSDPARPGQKTITANTPGEAREILRAKEKIGQRFIGMIHNAEPKE